MRKPGTHCKNTLWKDTFRKNSVWKKKTVLKYTLKPPTQNHKKTQTKHQNHPKITKKILKTMTQVYKYLFQRFWGRNTARATLMCLENGTRASTAPRGAPPPPTNHIFIIISCNSDRRDIINIIGIITRIQIKMIVVTIEPLLLLFVSLAYLHSFHAKETMQQPKCVKKLILSGQAISR